MIFEYPFNILHNARTPSGSVRQKTLRSAVKIAMPERIRIGPSVRRFSVSVQEIELSAKRFSDRAQLIFVLNVSTHV